MFADRFADGFTDNGRASAFAAFTAQPFFVSTRACGPGSSNRRGWRRGTQPSAARRPASRVATLSASAESAGQQPQAPPQQPPPPPPAIGLGIDGAPRPVNATVDNSFTVSSWPCGQVVGADASAMGRLTSKVSPQARHRNS
jgi:hypothetical protein